MWQNEPFPYFPPPDADPEVLAFWAAMISGASVRHADNIDRIVNGQIEFPTPGAPDHSGNVKVSYVQVVYDPSSVPAGTGQALCVRHGYGTGDEGQTPRGWFQMANSYSATSARFLDQVCSSAAPTPINVTGGGYTSARAVTATSVIGTGMAANNGWVGNDIRYGDQIKLVQGDRTTGTTGTVAAGSRVITLAAAPAQPLLPGWQIRFAAGAFTVDQTWHMIEEYDPNTFQVTVTNPYMLGVVATAMNYHAYDRSWVDILSVNLGAAGVGDTLTLASPGTECPLTGFLCEYVIRRPMDSNYAWLRFIGAGPFTESTIAFY